MKDINLLSRENFYQNDRNYAGLVKQLGIVFSVVFLVFLIGYTTIALLQWRLGSAEAVVEQQITVNSPILAVKKDIVAKQDNINQLTSLFGIIAANSTINTRIIDGIAGVMPDNIFILNYAVDKTGNLTIIGKSKDMDSIAYFVYKLKGTGLFNDVSLSNISNTNSASSNTGSPGYNFSATLKLKK